MYIPIPGPLWIGVFVGLCIFYYLRQVTRIRNNKKRERLQQKQSELLQSLAEKRNRET